MNKGEGEIATVDKHILILVHGRRSVWDGGRGASLRVSCRSMRCVKNMHEYVIALRFCAQHRYTVYGDT